MVQSMIFEKARLKKGIKIPRLKQICPKEKCFSKDGYFYLIYDTGGNARPNIGEINATFYEIYNKLRIMCYLGKEDSIVKIEEILFANIKNREYLAKLILELSELHDTQNKELEDIDIEYDKIEEIYNKYKDILISNDILTPSSELYKFCYYWPGLCIVLDFREIMDTKTKEYKKTVIGRSLIVKDAAGYIRGQISREDFGNSWNDVLTRVGPDKWIKNIKHKSVDGYEKTLNSDRFTKKKGEKIPVAPYVKLDVETE